MLKLVIFRGSIMYLRNTYSQFIDYLSKAILIHDLASVVLLIRAVLYIALYMQGS